MKFMVMCTLHPPAGLDPSRKALAPLAELGLLPVGCSRTEDGIRYGLDHVFVGEFRAREAGTLESMLHEIISGRLARNEVEVPIRLTLTEATSKAAPMRKRA